MTQKRHYFVVVIAIQSLLYVLPVAAKSWTAWSEIDEGSGHSNIYIIRDHSNQARQITHKGFNLTPSLYVRNDILWLAWVDRALPEQYILSTAKLNSNTLQIEQIEVVATSDLLIYSPNIYITANGTPLLVWGAFDGDDQEIRISRFLNADWQRQISITINELEDGRPNISLEKDSALTLNWEQISSSEITNQRILLDDVFDELEDSNFSQSTVPETGLVTIQPINTLPSKLANRQNDILMGTKFEITEKK